MKKITLLILLSLSVSAFSQNNIVYVRYDMTQGNASLVVSKINSIIDKYSPLMDRSDLYGTDKTPFIIYNPNITSQTITNVNSTFDNTPTIANLFNLNYDPRLYIGSDLFNNNTLVIYPNSDWINKDGVYTISNNTFTPFSDAVYTDEMIAVNNKIVSNNYILSYSIMDNNYFKYRDYLGNPKIKEGSN